MFYDNLKAICDQKGVKITPIVAECGGAKGSISNWKNGASPNSEIIAKLAVRLNVSSDLLIFGKEKSPSTELSEDERILLDNYNKLPERERQRLIGRAEALAEMYKEYHIVDIKSAPLIKMTTIKIAEIAAGAGTSTPFTIDDAFSPRSFPQGVIPPNADCGVPINGDSMEPKYPNGCIVWVNTKAEAAFGDTIIATLNGEPYCKIYQPDGLHSINPDYKPIFVGENDEFAVFGKVLGYYIKE